jgi:hypothetical protein
MYIYTPLSSFMDKSLYWMSNQKVEFPSIENIETNVHLGFVYFDRNEVEDSFTRKDLA